MKIGSILAAGATSLALLGVAGTASAAITVNNGTSADIPDGAVNDLLGPLGLGPSLDGYYGARLSGTGPAYRYDFYGFEAGFDNSFQIDEGGGLSEIFNNGDTGYDDTLENGGTILDSYTSTSLNFRFSTPEGDATNDFGGNPANTPDTVNFFVSIVGDPTATSGNAIWLFLDDNGADDDDNHDDMVIRISTVPVPAALPLLMGALGGLGLMARRRNS